MDTRARIIIKHVFMCFIFLHNCAADDCVADKFEGDIDLSLACYKSISQCSFGSLQKNHPTLYKKFALRQQKAAKFTVTSFCKLDEHGKNQSGLNIQWELQNTYGVQGIKGFEVRIEGYRRDFRCDILSLEQNITRDTIDAKFSGRVHKVTRRQPFRVTLISLPRTNESFLEYVDVQSLYCDRGMASNTWYSKTADYKYNWPKRELTIMFEEPPEVYNFTEFDVSIFSHFVFQQKISNSTSVVFPNVDPGTYLVNMQPHDPFRQNDELCLCRNDEGFCSSCYQNEWRIEVKKPVLKAPEDDTSFTTIIIVATSVGVWLLLVILFIIFLKVVAPRYGITCHIGDCCFSRTEKTSLLCLDASSSDMAKTFKKLLKKEFKHTINYQQVTYSSDMSSNFGQLVKEFGSEYRRNYIRTDLFCCKKYQIVDQKKCAKLIICLLVKDLHSQDTSHIYRSLCIEKSKLKLVHCDILVIYSTSDGIVSINNTYKLSDKKGVVSGIHKLLADTAVVEADQNKSSRVNSSFSNCLQGHCNITESPSMIELPAIKRYLQCDDHRLNECYKIQSKNRLVTSDTRERYLSNDSGHGASIKEGNGSWEEMTYNPIWNEQHLVPAMPKIQQLSYQQRSNSESFSFYPPSVLTEDDLDICEDFYNTDAYMHPCCHGNCHNDLSVNKNEGDDKSMMSLMNEMMAMNERSKLVRQDLNLEDVHTIWEEKV